MGRASLDLESCIPPVSSPLHRSHLPQSLRPAFNRQWHIPFAPLRPPAPVHSWLEDLKWGARWILPVAAFVGYGTFAWSIISFNPELALEGLAAVGQSQLLAEAVTALCAVKNLCTSRFAAKNTLKASFEPGGLVYETALAPQILKRLWNAAREFKGLDLGVPIGR